MAARFDAARAATLGQTAGDGTPIMLTIPTERAVGAAAHPRPRSRQDAGRRRRRVPAHRPRAEAARRWPRPRRSAARASASASLLDDLRSDKGMGWVPDRHVVHVPPARRAGRDARLRPRGLGRTRCHGSPTPASTRRTPWSQSDDDGRPIWPWPVGLAVAAATFLAVVRWSARRTQRFGHERRRRAARAGGVLAVAVGAVAVLGGYAVAAVGADAGHRSRTRTGTGDGARRHPLQPVHARRLARASRGRWCGSSCATTIRSTTSSSSGPPRCTRGDHARHRAPHPPVPGEVSVNAPDDGVTFYKFDQAGDFLYTCHLPGHVAYGMFGNITVVPRSLPAGPSAAGG